MLLQIGTLKAVQPKHLHQLATDTQAPLVHHSWGAYFSLIDTLAEWALHIPRVMDIENTSQFRL